MIKARNLKPKPVNPRILEQQRLIDIKLKDKFISFQLKQRLKHSENPSYKTNRGYKDYNLAFDDILTEKSLLEFIKNRFKTKKLKILEEGAGQTVFLNEIKDLLLKEGIKSETTAITLTPGVTRKNTRANILIKKDSLKTTKLQEYDLIFSVFGGIHYNIKELDRNLVLKFANSLSKNGVFFIGVNRLGAYKSLVLQKVNYKGFFNNITKSLNKAGFNVDCNFVPVNGLRHLPIFIFKITRK